MKKILLSQELAPEHNTVIEAVLSVVLYQNTNHGEDSTTDTDLTRALRKYNNHVNTNQIHKALRCNFRQQKPPNFRKLKSEFGYVFFSSALGQHFCYGKTKNEEYFFLNLVPEEKNYSLFIGTSEEIYKLLPKEIRKSYNFFGNSPGVVLSQTAYFNANPNSDYDNGKIELLDHARDKLEQEEGENIQCRMS